MKKQRKTTQLTCKNPDCGKEIREGLDYCSQDCVKKHIVIRQSERKNPKNRLRLTSEEDIWFGRSCSVCH